MERWLWRSFVWHEWLVRVTRGKVGGRFGKLRFLLLHHVGARSGAARTTPLLYRPLDGGGFVVIASKGGASSHPAWFHNLVAHPEVEVEIPGGSRRVDVHARVVKEGPERERLWTAMASDWRFFDGYARRAAPRRIPVVVLEPRGERLTEGA